MLQKLQRIFFPTKSNNYYPHALRKGAFGAYVVFLLIVNSFSFLFISPQEAAAASIDVNRLVELANQERVTRGLNTLTVDSRLVTAAANKGADMFAKQYWAHYGPNGETPWQFIKAAGYNYVYAGENLAKDFTSTDPIHTAWMNSPSHRDNIINTHYEDIGIAAVEGIFDGVQTIIVVQMFGSEYDQPEPEPEPEPQPEPEPEPEPTPSEPPAPEPTPQDTTPPAKPEITEPEDGAILNVSDFHIKGNAESGSEVSIYDGDELIGTLNADGGAFDHREEEVDDGGHVLSATAKDNSGNISQKSDDVNVTIDTIAPEINSDSFQLLSWDESAGSYNVDIVIEGAPIEVQAVLGDYTLDLAKTDNDRWQGNFAPGADVIAEEGRSILIIATDEAGNLSEQLVLLPDLGAPNGGIEILPITGDEDLNIFQKVWKKFADFWSSASTIQKINVSVGIFLLMLALIDLVIVWRKGIKRQGGSSANHLPILILLILAIIFASTGLIL